MRYDVFISYSFKDRKTVEGICGFLESKGIRCFVAYRDIPIGAVWAKRVVEGLESSRMMVVVFSENFNYSDQVDREIEIASEERLPILTFRLSETQFSGAKKYYLKNLNWIDAFPNPEEAFGSLYGNICKLLNIKNEPLSTTNIKPDQKGGQVSAQKKEPSSQKKKAKEKPHLTAGMLGMDEPTFANYIRADDGDIDSMYWLAQAYATGQGVRSINQDKYLYWCRKAATLGNLQAQVELIRNDKSYDADIKWFKAAYDQYKARAEKGTAKDWYEFAMFLDKHEDWSDGCYEEGPQWVLKAAKAKYPDAVYMMHRYYQGYRGAMEEDCDKMCECLVEAYRLGSERMRREYPDASLDEILKAYKRSWEWMHK